MESLLLELENLARGYSRKADIAAAPYVHLKGPRPVKRHVQRPIASSRRHQRRKLFLDQDLQILTELEILEMVLWLGQKRADMRPLATRLLQRFETLAKLIEGSQEAFQDLQGWNERARLSLRLIAEAEKRLATPKVYDQPVLANWESLVRYVHDTARSGADTEDFRLLLLNGKNRLLVDVPLPSQAGNSTAAIVKQGIAQALSHNASALILVSQCQRRDLLPVSVETALTRRFAAAATSLSLTFHDHLIFDNLIPEPFSFRKSGLL